MMMSIQVQEELLRSCKVKSLIFFSIAMFIPSYFSIAVNIFL
jgi:hypothetical protein